MWTEWESEKCTSVSKVCEDGHCWNIGEELLSVVYYCE